MHSYPLSWLGGVRMRENMPNINIRQKLGKDSVIHEIWKCNQRQTDIYATDASLSLVQSSIEIATPTAKRLEKSYEKKCRINNVVCFGTGM
jgi:hypothetical protein